MPSRSYPSVTVSVHRREFVIEPSTHLAGTLRHILETEVALPVSVDRSFWWLEDDLIPPTAKVGLHITEGIAALSLEWTDADEAQYRDEFEAARVAREAAKDAARAAAEAEDAIPMRPVDAATSAWMDEALALPDDAASPGTDPVA